jgi:tetratricopeptide (TPR) repeat protein
MDETSLVAALRALRLEKPALTAKEMAHELGHDDISLIKKLSGKVTKQLAKEGLLPSSSAPAPATTGKQKAAAPPTDEGPKNLACTSCGAAMAKANCYCNLCFCIGLSTCPLYCSPKCKRVHTVAHKQEHRELAVKIEHRRAEQDHQLADSSERCLSHVKDDYDLQNVAAMQLLQQGQQKAAIKKLQKLVKERPWEPEAHFNLGGVRAQRGELVEALEAFSEAFDWHTEGCTGWAQSAIMLHEVIRRLRTKKRLVWVEPTWHKDPIQQWIVGEVVAQVVPQDDGGWMIVADARSRMGDDQEAAEAWKMAEEMEKKHAWARHRDPLGSLRVL